MLRSNGVLAFFQYARRRHEIYLRRQAGDPPPWTRDPILQQYRFTNVFRELDRTTIWCREHVRERYDGIPEVLPAVVVFRWFNKIETGEAMFERWGAGHSPFDEWLLTGDVAQLRRSITDARGDGPYVNGAYIVKSPAGMSKLDGVLQCCERFRTESRLVMNWRQAGERARDFQFSLEALWNWLREFDQQGDFTAYEVVTDLRHTYLLRNAPDIMTWANAGPGAVRGLNRLQGRPTTQSLPKDASLAEMRELLLQSSRVLHWPREWGQWEMREVEHTLCEFDKYQRATTGEGTPKQRYSGEG